MNYSFNSSALNAQSFNPTIGGTTYTAQVTWNIFAGRWYLNLYDVSQNLIIACALVSSADPQNVTGMSWEDGLLTVTTVDSQTYRIGQVQDIFLSGASSSTVSGVFEAAWITANSFTIPMTTEPTLPTIFGTYGSIIDLTQGQISGGALYYFANNSYFMSTP